MQRIWVYNYFKIAKILKIWLNFVIFVLKNVVLFQILFLSLEMLNQQFLIELNLITLNFITIF